VTRSGLEIRPLTPDDDIEAELDLRRRAFGPVAAANRPRWVAAMRANLEAGQMLGAFDGTRLVGSARYYAMRQWWHGQSMPMAGVAGVKVAPEERGRGVGKALVTRLLAEIAGNGYPISALYPSTLPIYRSMGWEVAGSRYEAELPAAALAVLTSPDREVATPPAESGAARLRGAGPGPRRAGPGDAESIVSIQGLVHAALRECGPTTRQPSELVAWLEDENHFAYLVDDGFLSYRWAARTTVVEVEVLVAGSAATARAFWQILASHATMAKTIRACVGPDDPITWLAIEPTVAARRLEPWMLRLVDAPQAFAARGYPAGVSVSADLEITDALMPGNSGRWTLEVSGGAGKLSPASGRSAGSALRLGSRGVSALFAGTPMATLRRAGLVAGGEAAGGEAAVDDALDCAFAGRAYMTDHF
jgi:predicted acetyltransferase